MHPPQGAMMDLPAPPGGWIPGLGVALAVVCYAAVKLRKLLSSDAVDRAGDGAKIDVITMLQRLLDAANARNTELVRALDGAHDQIGQLRAQVAALSEQVSALQDQVRRLSLRKDNP